MAPTSPRATERQAPEATAPDRLATHGGLLAGNTTTSGATGQRHPPLSAAPQPRRTLWPYLALAVGVLVLIGLGVGLGVLLQGDQRQRANASSAHGAGDDPSGRTRSASAKPRAPDDAPAFDRLAWRLHPGDTFLLARLHHAELKRSTVYRAIREASGKSSDNSGGKSGAGPLTVLKRVCGLDLLEHLTWVSLGLSGPADDPNADVLLRGRMTRGQVEDCFRAFAREGGDRTDPVHRAGRLTRVHLGGAHVWLAWPDSRTVMLSTRTHADEQWFRARLAGQKPASSRERLHRLYGHLDSRPTLWVLSERANSTPGDAGLLQGISPDAGGWVSVRAKKDLVLRAAAVFDSREAARRATEILQGRLEELAKEPFVGFLLQRARVSQQGNQTLLALELEERLAGVFGAAVASALGEVDWKALMGMTTANPAPRRRPAREPADPARRTAPAR